MSPYPTPLTPNQIQASMQLLTANILGLWTPPMLPPDTSSIYSTIRVGWQQKGQPFNDIDVDTIYLRCWEVDDQYNRIRDIQMLPNPADTNDPPQSVLQVTTYQRIWVTQWELYGPNSFDKARQLRSGLFTQAVHDTFAALNLNLYWVTDPAAPVRIPPFSDGEWWERTDFDSRFNEGVTEVIVIPIAASVEIKVYSDEQGAAQPMEDFTVPLQGGYGEGGYGGGGYGE